MKKKDTRGRKAKMHAPIKASFDAVLSAIGKSQYKDKKTLKRTTKRGK